MNVGYWVGGLLGLGVAIIIVLVSKTTDLLLCFFLGAVLTGIGLMVGSAIGERYER